MVKWQCCIAKRDDIVLSDISLQWCVSERNAPRKAHDFTAVKSSVLDFTPILDYSSKFVVIKKKKEMLQSYENQGIEAKKEEKKNTRGKKN